MGGLDERHAEAPARRIGAGVILDARQAKEVARMTPIGRPIKRGAPEPAPLEVPVEAPVEVPA